MGNNFKVKNEMNDIKKHIRTVPDFPIKGIQFRDITSLLENTKAFNKALIEMTAHCMMFNANKMIGIESRGFIFGSAIALQSSKPMIVARKPGKLPGETVTEKYKLEYGENSLSIQKNSLKKYNTFAIVDDLLATGGTVNCVANLLKRNGKKILGLLTVVELVTLKGRSKFNFPVESSISF